MVLDARFAQRISTRLDARRIVMLRPHATGKEGVGALVAASAFQAGGDPIVISLKKPGRALRMVEIARRDGVGRIAMCVRRMCTRLVARWRAMRRRRAVGTEGAMMLGTASALQDGVVVIAGLGKTAQMAGAGRSVTCVRRMCLGGVATRRGA